MKAFGFLLRIYSYLFHLILSLFLLGLALLTGGGSQSLKLAGLLPFTDEKMFTGLLTLGAVGLLSTLLAITNIFKYFFPVWATIVLVLMVKGFIFSTYSFGGQEGFRAALWLIFACVGAFFGALWVLKPRKGRL